jgi:basic amino acid/polyamine antiporter, APA family
MSDPKRTLNLFDTIMLVSGSMIGSGIFIVSADMMRVLGSPFWVLFCWILSGVITLFAALSYGELAGMMPDAGGQFIYLKRAYGKLTAFVYGWTVFTVIQTGVIAAVAVAFARFMGVLFPFFDEQHILFAIGSFSISSTQALAVFMIFFLSFLNSKGINNGKIIQRVFTSAKILSLLGLIVVGFIAGSGAGFWEHNIGLPFQAANEGASSFSLTTLLSALGVAMIGALFSSDAWNNVTFIAGEIKNPRRNIPLGLFSGVLIVTILYVMANVAYFMLLPAHGSSEGLNALERGIAYAENDRVGTAALSTVFGNVSSSIMALLIIISTFGCNNGLILSGARLFQSMASNELFFKKAADLNQHGVPAKSLYIQGTWASILCLSGSYGSLLDYCTFASLIFYMITISTLFYFRRKEPNALRPYKAFGYPLIPALYILVTLAICIDLLIFKTRNTGLGLLIMFIGVPVFYFFDKHKKNQNTAK